MEAAAEGTEAAASLLSCCDADCQNLFSCRALAVAAAAVAADVAAGFVTSCEA